MKHFSKKSRSKRKIWKRVADGIYRHRISRTLFERPKHFINGEDRWTFRSLLTKNLKLAKEEYHRRKVSRATGPGSSPRIRISDAAEVIVGEVIQRYVDDGCPDRFRKERPINTKQTEQHNCETLLEYWDRIPFSGLTLAACDRYHDWRCDRITRGTGDRTHVFGFPASKR